MFNPQRLRRVNGRVLFVLCLILSWLGVRSGVAATLTVPGQYASIQAAVDAAQEGDEVVVSPGTYSEEISFTGRNIVLRSTNPEDPSTVAATVIQGSQGYPPSPVVEFTGRENRTCVLSGFTVQGGGDSSYVDGGGVSGNGTVATIQYCVIRGNIADSGGGLDECDGLITSNTIEQNYASRGGGGLYQCQGEIRNNIIRDNQTDDDGGGLGECRAILQDNIITSNTATGYGGGLYSCRGPIENNTISNNKADKSGGGFYDSGSTIMRGNTISGNHAVLDGGGGYSPLSGTTPFEENVVENNTAGGNGGGISASNVPLVNNVIRNNVAGGIGGGLHRCSSGGVGNQITGNQAGGDGGGAGDCGGTFESNIITDNTAQGNGGGVQGRLLVLTANVIARNQAQTGGGYALTAGSTSAVRENLIHHNTATLLGGGGFGGSLENDTLVDNSAPRGGGVASPSQIRNTILWGNSATTDSQIMGTALPARSCIQDWTGGGVDNITADPLFRDSANGDYHLTAGSPCIDKIDPWVEAYDDLSDLDNYSRLAGAGIDMGCYEYASGPDQDHDWYLDAEEPAAGLDPTNPDTDGDGLPDGLERFRGTDPTVRNPPTGLAIPGDYPSIQEALFLAFTSETLTVSPGVYHESLRFRRPYCILTGTDPLSSGTVNATVINPPDGEYGIYLSDAGVVRGIAIRDAVEAITGGGPRSRIERCDLRRSQADAIVDCNGVMANNVIAQNSGPGFGYCNGLIEGNLVVENGGGTYYYAGGLQGCEGYILGNTIAFNHSSYPGGGIYSCKALIRNNIVWGNTSSDGSQIDSSHTPAYCCIQDWSEGGTGNIAADPKFVDASGGNYRLAADSPCIDIGISIIYPVFPYHDLDANLRQFGAGVDMGCYEYGAPADRDGDLIADDEEASYGTNPTLTDTDGDGIPDGLELLRGSDPLTVTPPGVIEVPAQLESIQLALSASVPGDEIVVAPGTYKENLIFPGHDVVLQGSAPSDPNTADQTVIDGTQSQSVIHLTGRESAECRIAGLNLVNGQGLQAGGILGNGTKATLDSCRIGECRTDPSLATFIPGAIADCDGTIENCRIENNTCVLLDLGQLSNPVGVVDQYIGSSAGALYGCDGTITGNTIRDNRSGALLSCAGEILGNQILDNGGFAISGSARLVEDNLIQGNQGAITLVDGAIRKNRIVQNISPSDVITQCSGPIERNWIEGNAGTITLSQCSGAVQNNIFLNNVSTYELYLDTGGIENNTMFNGDGGMLFISDCRGSIRNNILWGHTVKSAELQGSTFPEYCSIQGWTLGGTGNLTSDPRLVDPANGDLRLASDSPCIDAGGAVAGLTTDYAGTPRPYDGTSQPRGDGSDYDIGAYEYDGTNLGVVPQPTPRAPGVLHVPADYSTIQKALYAAVSGDDIIVAPGTYDENIHFLGKNVSLQSEDPRDPTVVAQTIIEARGGAAVVTFKGTEATSAVLSGFTITGGGGNFSQQGGGVDGNRCYATIEHNIITGNLAYDGGGMANVYGVIRYNTIEHNWADSEGGGLFECTGEIYNNLIAFNNSEFGGGMYDCGSYSFSTPSIRNNTIYGNQAARESGGTYSCEQMTNCIVWGNTGPGYQVNTSYGNTYNCIEDWPYGGEGNIALDPLFVDPSRGDFRLGNGSPCVDTGNPIWNDACLPPGEGTEMCDMGVYGGPDNCDWQVAVTPAHLIAFILSGAQPPPELIDQCDANNDGILDVGDIIYLLKMK